MSWVVLRVGTVTALWVAMKHTDALSLCSGTEDKSKNGISFQSVTFFDLVNSKRESDIIQNFIL